MSRSAIYTALLNLASGLTWGSPTRSFVGTSRRVRAWTDVPDQPYLCQAEHGETVTQATRMPHKLVLEASWLIYHAWGKGSDNVPADESNLILDAIFGAFPATAEPDERQTLGGLAHKAWIDGRIIKAQGDLDGQSLLIVPIKVLVP